MELGNMKELCNAKAPDAPAARLIHAQLVNSGESQHVVAALEEYIGAAELVDKHRECLKSARGTAKDQWKEVQARAAKRIKGDATL